ncbi:uncharacterized protein V6R79_011510 [Siganus canaliculatus]
METQTYKEMASDEMQERITKEPTEEVKEEEKQFLKELYVFMKKRDTPIERIPNLGFKQIDLYLMFKTVSGLGGYHQVTSQQLWKQVYNTLGGNPRSTSAATCTRRHYEKLLLPYECHVKGITMTMLPQHQPKHFHYPIYSKDDEDEDGPRPAKRKLLSIPLRQAVHHPPSDQHGRAFPLPLHYPHYYHPSHAVLPPHIPISPPVLTPQSRPVSQPQFFYDPYHLSSTERVQEPLEHLRYLAERYKTSSGLMEPLNLSVKAPRPEADSKPISSFAPPSSSKNPKFLNKPSPLYSHGCPQVARSDRCDAQDDEANSEDPPSPTRSREAYMSSCSPTYDPVLTLRADEGRATVVQSPSSPKTDFKMLSKAESDWAQSGLSLGRMMPSLPRENERGEMEIEIPLSVFQSWLKLCRSSGKQFPTLEEPIHGPDTDVLYTNLTVRMNPQNWSSVADDLRLRPKSSLSPVPTNLTTSNHHNPSQYSFSSYKPFPSSGILKSPVNRDQQDAGKLYGSNPPHGWDTYDQETRARKLVKRDSTSPTVQQNFASPKSSNEDRVQEEKGSSTSPFQLTSEEVMKLKKIISSSL